MDITVPSAEDYNELTQLWEASVRATHHFLKEEDIQFYKPLILNEYLKSVRLHCIRSTAGVIQGFIGTSEHAIEMLFVHPAARGTGVGKALAVFAIQSLGCSKVDVNEDNLQALGFYEKLGFEMRARSLTDGMGKPYPILHMELQ